MKTLLFKSLVILALIFSNQANASSDQCLIDIDVAGWKDLETVLFIASGGYAITNDKKKAEYTAMIDEVEGDVQRCLYGCDEKQEVLLILSVFSERGNLVYTKNKIATQVTSHKRRILERESDVVQTKKMLLRSIPECEFLRF